MILTLLRIALLNAVALLFFQTPAPSPASMPCAANTRYPRSPRTSCAETMIELPFTPGAASIMALALGPDGSLYFARPATSEIDVLPVGADGQMVAPYAEAHTFTSDLAEAPNGLTYYEGAWYVSGDSTIVRLRDTNSDGKADEMTVLVSDLPGGGGGWLGNIHVGPDKRLYVAKASRCDTCANDDLRRGALLSFALDGSDPRIVARGLRDAYDFAWDDSGKLYIVDNERPDMPAELNVIPQPGIGPAPDFGWPRCGAAQTGRGCDGVTGPAVTFPAGSHPMGISFYRGQFCAAANGCLVVMLAGSWNAIEMSGYSVDLISIEDQGKMTAQVLLPDPAFSYPRLSDNALRLIAFYPDHPVSVTISRENWIYLAVSEGRIYRYRPYPK